MGWTIESVRSANVEPAVVFALYADPATWSRWGHNATWARADGPLVEGGVVDVRANYGKVYHCRIRRLVPDRALELVVRPPLLTIVNIYEVGPARDGARIRHAFEVSGPLAPVTRLIGLDRAYRRQLDEGISAVIAIATGSGVAGRREPRAAPATAPERAWHGLGRLARRGRDG